MTDWRLTCGQPSRAWILNPGGYLGACHHITDRLTLWYLTTAQTDLLLCWSLTSWQLSRSWTLKDQRIRWTFCTTCWSVQHRNAMPERAKWHYPVQCNIMCGICITEQWALLWCAGSIKYDQAQQALEQGEFDLSCSDMQQLVWQTFDIVWSVSYDRQWWALIWGAGSIKYEQAQQALKQGGVNLSCPDMQQPVTNLWTCFVFKSVSNSAEHWCGVQGA